MDYKAYKKKLEPIVAIGIFLSLVFIIVLFVAEHQLKKEINENCGWETEDYKCYCQKEDVKFIEDILNENYTALENLGNISFVK